MAGRFSGTRQLYLRCLTKVVNPRWRDFRCPVCPQLGTRTQHCRTCKNQRCRNAPDTRSPTANLVYACVETIEFTIFTGDGVIVRITKCRLQMRFGHRAHVDEVHAAPERESRSLV